jgi:hypothetical protein
VTAAAARTSIAVRLGISSDRSSKTSRSERAALCRMSSATLSSWSRSISGPNAWKTRLTKRTRRDGPTWQVKASDVPAEVRGARVGVADRPQVQGEERLRPTVGPDGDRDEVGRVVREQAHRVEVARLVVGSVAVVVELTASVTVEDAVLPRVEAPRLDRLLARHEVNHRRLLPLQLLEKFSSSSVAFIGLRRWWWRD